MQWIDAFSVITSMPDNFTRWYFAAMFLVNSPMYHERLSAYAYLWIATCSARMRHAHMTAMLVFTVFNRFLFIYSRHFMLAVKIRSNGCPLCVSPVNVATDLEPHWLVGVIASPPRWKSHPHLLDCCMPRCFTIKLQGVWLGMTLIRH